MGHQAGIKLGIDIFCKVGLPTPTLQQAPNKALNNMKDTLIRTPLRYALFQLNEAYIPNNLKRMNLDNKIHDIIEAKMNCWRVIRRGEQDRLTWLLSKKLKNHFLIAYPLAVFKKKFLDLRNEVWKQKHIRKTLGILGIYEPWKRKGSPHGSHTHGGILVKSIMAKVQMNIVLTWRPPFYESQFLAILMWFSF